MINVDGSAARLLATGALAKAGYCLYYCWLAISRGLVHYITGGVDTAYNTWLAVPETHRHSSRNVPKDFPAFLGTKITSRAGDVIISRGDGTFVATDWPKAKQVGICTLEQREKQTGRKFVGWASSMGGHVLTSTTTAGSAATPFPNEEEVKEEIDMYIIYNRDSADDNNRRAYVGPRTFTPVSPATSVALNHAGVVTGSVTQAEWDDIEAVTAEGIEREAMLAGKRRTLLFNRDDSNDGTRRAVVGPGEFFIVSPNYATGAGRVWGGTQSVNQAGWDAKKIAAATPAGSTGGASKADVESAADRVIGKIPTEFVAK